MTDCSNSVNGIVDSWFKRYWDAGLSEEERRLLLEAVKELHSAGFVRRDESQRSSDFVVLTDAGKDVVELQQDPDARSRKFYP